MQSHVLLLAVITLLVLFLSLHYAGLSSGVLSGVRRIRSYYMAQLTPQINIEERLSAVVDPAQVIILVILVMLTIPGLYRSLGCCVG